MNTITEGFEKIPSHFFEKGDYEVWSPRHEYKGGHFTGKITMQMIAGNLSLETAKAFNWPNKEIRLHGEAVN